MFHRSTLLALFLVLMVGLTISQKDENLHQKPAKKNLSKEEKLQITIKKLVAAVHKYLVVPLKWIIDHLMKLNQKLQDQVANKLDQMFEKVWNAGQKLYTLLVMIPVKVLEAVAKAVPSLAGDVAQQIKHKVEECNKNTSLDSIHNSAKDLKICIITPLKVIISKQLLINNETDQLVGVLETSLDIVNKSEESNRLEKLYEAGTNLVDNGLPHISNIIHLGKELIAELPKVVGCVLGEKTKTVLLAIIDTAQKYANCLTGKTEVKVTAVEKQEEKVIVEGDKKVVVDDTVKTAKVEDTVEVPQKRRK